MKVFYLIYFLFLLVISASGQMLPGAAGISDVSVIKNGWRIEVRNPALEVDPFRANTDHDQLLLDQQETAKLNEDRAKKGLPQERVPVRVRQAERNSREISTVYIYETKLKNVGNKTIQAITWDYAFFGKKTATEIGRRRFTNVVTIRPGKTENFSIRSVSPPTGTISAKGAKEFREQCIEKVFIQRIEYTDGTVWQSETMKLDE